MLNTSIADRSAFRNSISSVSRVSLFLFFLASVALGQEVSVQRVEARDYPLVVSVPKDWEAFKDDPETPEEILFLQTPEGAKVPATVLFTAHRAGEKWQDQVRRQTYHLLVWRGVPLITNDDITLKGAKGHKWVYVDTGDGGVEKLFYRLYLFLPSTVGKNRLLLMEASAPSETGPQAIPFFNQLARSLTWGAARINLSEKETSDTPEIRAGEAE